MSEMIYTMANTKIFISESPVQAKLEVTPEDFQGVNWVEIKGLFNVGELGAEQAVNEYELISSDWMLKAKGTRNGGTMTNVFIPLHLDPGQVMLREAIEDGCRPYAFRVDRGADCAPESLVTISIADPGVVTWPLTASKKASRSCSALKALCRQAWSLVRSIMWLKT